MRRCSCYHYVVANIVFEFIFISVFSPDSFTIKLMERMNENCGDHVLLFQVWSKLYHFIPSRMTSQLELLVFKLIDSY